MYQEYFITYSATNNYDTLVKEAYWQFLILPEDNDSQQLVSWEFSDSLSDGYQSSVNGYGFKAIKVHPQRKFRDISFNASFTVIKKEIDPFAFSLPLDNSADYAKLKELGFQVDFEPFLRKSHFTQLPEVYEDIYPFDPNKSVFKNLLALNHWISQNISFKTGATDVHTTPEEILRRKEGVCQDFTHLFCALAKRNGVPARYVSGYLHQGMGYFGDSQMHAWAEAYLPHVGWVGFDPTNDILAHTDHVKVCHGKDYSDCAPLKGVVYSSGDNETSYTVNVWSAQQQ